MNEESTPDAGAVAEQQPATDASEIESAFVTVIDKASSGTFDTAFYEALWNVTAPIATAIVLLIVTLVAAKVAASVTRKAATKARVEVTLARFFGTVARWGVILLGGIAILGNLGIETASFAAVIAAMGFAIGLALSGLLGNVSAGIMLLIFRPFKVGDYVNAAGVAGTIDEVGLFTTAFDTPDKRRIIVPNGKIFGDTIENVTHHPIRRIQVDVGTAYDADIDRTRQVLEDAVKGVEGILEEPAPAIYLDVMGDSSIAWAVRVWSKTEDFWAVRERTTRAVKYALDNANISIPFPQMDVHIDGKVPSNDAG